MITFISIFLGLVTGVKPVELAVSGDVLEIEVRLDGEVVGWLREEPWKLECDFGSDLATHELVAVARGRRGAELARVAQLINVPRPLVDTRILLDDWQSGRPRSARLRWQTIEPTEPTSVSVVLDGEILADRYLERYQLPELDPDSIHFLSARMEFPESRFSSAEVVFGGTFGSSADTELTAVPLLVTDRKLRRLERLQGRLEENGITLHAFAVENGPAEVVMVRDRRAIPRLAKLDSAYYSRPDKYVSAALAKDDALLVMSPRAYLTGQGEERYAVYPASPPMTRKNVSLPWLLANFEFTRGPVLPQRLTDAVAAAGLLAAASQKRRAVVLVTSDCADVPGQWSPQGVRRFLAQLRVPFRVWQVEPPAAGASAAGGFCDGVQSIHIASRYHTAIRHLRRDLLTQLIVWVEGRHLQRKITLTGDGSDVRLAD